MEQHGGARVSRLREPLIGLHRAQFAGAFRLREVKFAETLVLEAATTDRVLVMPPRGQRDLRDGGRPLTFFPANPYESLRGSLSKPSQFLRILLEFQFPDALASGRA